MGLNFRKRVSILPGLTLNFGKRGTSVTIGKRGASVNISKRGVYGNAGIPGTGLHYRERLDKPKQSRGQQKSRKVNSQFYSSSSSSNYSTISQDESQSKGMMILLLAVFAIAIIIFFVLSFRTAEHSPGIRILLYSVASTIMAFWMAFLGISIKTNRKVDNNLGVILGGVSLIATGVVFLIWSHFWPDYTMGYRMYYGARIPESVDLDGWKTFGSVLSWISIILGVVIAFIVLKNNSMLSSIEKKKLSQ